MDDIIVVSTSVNEHHTHLVDLFDRILSYGFHFQMSKCMFMLPRSSYLGIIIDENDRRHNGNKMAMLQKLSGASNKANYYNIFAPNMQSLLATLDNLC